jgi:hypothetical protein
MSKNKTIEEVLLPNELQILGNVEDGLKTEFLDAELDAFEVNFNYDNCATIDTNGMKYIAISRNTLIKLARLVDIADKRYEEKL